jgi:hypothetical protein
MIFYNCVEPPTLAERQSRALVDTTCGNKTLVGVPKGPDVSGSYFLEGCNASVVPMLVRSGQTNPTNYKELIDQRRIPLDMATVAVTVVITGR